MQLVTDHLTFHEVSPPLLQGKIFTGKKLDYLFFGHEKSVFFYLYQNFSQKRQDQICKPYFTCTHVLKSVQSGWMSWVKGACPAISGLPKKPGQLHELRIDW